MGKFLWWKWGKDAETADNTAGKSDGQSGGSRRIPVTDAGDKGGSHRIPIDVKGHGHDHDHGQHKGHTHGRDMFGGDGGLSEHFQTCSFCNRTMEEMVADHREKRQSDPLMDQGPEVVPFLMIGSKDGEHKICSDCITAFNGNIEEVKGQMKAQSNEMRRAMGLPVAFDDGAAGRFGMYSGGRIKKLSAIPKPSDLKAQLDEYVLGQERLKRRLSVAIVNHYERIEQKKSGAKLKDGEAELGKANVLIMGPTGTGKTLSVETAAKKLNVPFAKWDATTLTSEGFVGKKPHDIMEALLESCNWDVERAQNGIVFIDEIDKLARNGGNGANSYAGGLDVGGAGAQQSLLRMLEGSVIEVPDAKRQRYVKIDTSNILFITGGAFTQLKEIIFDRKKKAMGTTIGFSAEARAQQLTVDSVDIGEATEEDLKNAGLLPELIGRLQIRTNTDPLSAAELRRILTEPKDALVKQYQTLFRNKKQGAAELEFSDDALQLIAERAAASGTGGRGLRSMLEDILVDAMYDVPSTPGIEKVVVTRDTVANHAVPQYIMKPPVVSTGPAAAPT
jgi:ATP-dependent Clp protease ATP-binding subunit ClpX